MSVNINEFIRPKCRLEEAEVHGAGLHLLGLPADVAMLLVMLLAAAAVAAAPRDEEARLDGLEALLREEEEVRSHHAAIQALLVRTERKDGEMIRGKMKTSPRRMLLISKRLDF